MIGKATVLPLGFLLVVSLFTACQQAPNQEGGNNKGEVRENSTMTEDTLGTAGFRSYSAEAVMGEVVYVPVYSHIYQRDQKRTFNLTTTLSFRNTDLNHPLTLKKVYYFDSNGNLVQKYLDKNKSIEPLSSVSYVIEESDLRGGVGANFLVLWEAAQKVNQPVVESVMISTSHQQGISFVSEGRATHSLHRTPE